jgi:hypothetical protein
MLASGVPTSFPIIWGASAVYIRPIPTTSQIGINNGFASLPDGFVPLNQQPVAAGGIPPYIQDMNGILNQLSAWAQWQEAGGPIVYNSTLQTAIGGYAQGAIVQSATTLGILWMSTADNNTTNPDASGAGWVPVTRIRLAANTSFYVATTGSDSANTGLTSGSPWATLQHAWNFISSNYDLNGHQVTINVADGAYSSGCASTGAMVGQISPVIFNGDTPTPANCIISLATGNCFSSSNGANITVQGFTLQVSGGGGSCLAALYGGIINQQANIFAPCFTTANHMSIATGGIISINSNYNVTGGAGAHIANTGGSVILPAAMTIFASGSIGWAQAFIVASGSGSNSNMAGMNFSGGTYSGPRYAVTLNAVVNTNGGGANFFPGNSAGSSSTGGQYA